ncbi:hypothetical protein ETA_26390 [Erwinia tasmaniensis Et1/99]|uniref:Uncharacterized protein n=1 Tax=Erwinia tasmaniensis (strain DSM 17950 / CFBP 7177 / CIP 109463 / NCPPB 4357 / Et1/99) TaxID=465817 RepID=B2VHK1_ERWT9|nr:hypothetical protein ETA_26390 [Erwinia tasmaniensis Et1/99]
MPAEAVMTVNCFVICTLAGNLRPVFRQQSEQPVASPFPGCLHLAMKQVFRTGHGHKKSPLERAF